MGGGKAIIFILLVVVSVNMHAQEKPGFRYTDSLTYAYWMEKRWPELIEAGNDAISNGYDYYYLRMRLGIAFYEKKNYTKASGHFKKAQEFNSGDPTALEYLFYSFLLSGRYNQARAVLGEMTPANRDRISKESRLRKNTVTIESFYSRSATSGIISEPGKNFPDPEPGSQVVSESFLNNAVYATHTLGNNASFLHAYTNLQKENYYYYYDGTGSASIDNQKVVQNQYYGSLSFFSADGWTFAPAFHLLSTSYPLLYFDYTGSVPEEVRYNVKQRSYAISASVYRTGGYFSIGTEGAYSDLNGMKQSQAGLSLTVNPYGNNNLYAGYGVFAVLTRDADISDSRIINRLTAGFSLFNKLWIDITGLSGDMQNYLGSNGLIVYNSADLLQHKVNITLTLPFPSAGLSVYASGGRGWYKSKWIPFSAIGSHIENTLTYQNNFITGGLSWNF